MKIGRNIIARRLAKCTELGMSLCPSTNPTFPAPDRSSLLQDVRIVNQ